MRFSEPTTSNSLFSFKLKARMLVPVVKITVVSSFIALQIPLDPSTSLKPETHEHE